MASRIRALPASQQFPTVFPFSRLLGDAEVIFPGYGLSPESYARQNLLATLSKRYPHVFRDAKVRLSHLRHAPRWSDTWTWQGEYKEEALAWAEHWHLGSEISPEFPAVVFRFAYLELRVAGNPSLMEQRLFPCIQKVALDPVGCVVEPIPDLKVLLDDDERDAVLDELTAASTLDQLSVFEHDSLERLLKVRGIPAKACEGDHHYRWLLDLQIAGYSRNEIAEREGRDKSAISRALTELAPLVEIPLRPAKMGRPLGSRAA